MDGEISKRKGNINFKMAIRNNNIANGIKSSALLGWRIETNWANIFIVFLVKCSKPFSVALLLSAMYMIASGPEATIYDLSWAIIGVCLWGFIQSATELYSYAIVGEREWFRNIKNIITAPTPLHVYLLGRTSLWIPVGLLNFIVILSISNYSLNLGLDINSIEKVKMVLFLLLGFIPVVSLGMFVAGISLVIPRFSEGVAFGVTGVLYLISGSIIKTDMLPTILKNISEALPFTHWIEIIRYTMFPYFRINPAPYSEFFITSIIFCLVTNYLYFFLLNYARKSGKIDLASMY